MKSKIIGSAFLACVLMTTGCNDFINDIGPTNKVSSKIMWNEIERVEGMLNYFYQYINVYGSFGGNGESQVGLTEGLTETLKYSSMVPGTNVGFANTIAFADGGLEAKTAAFHLGVWDNTYDRIRRINEFLSDLKKYSKFDQATNERLIAEARFFRGMLYYELVRRNGDVILYDEDMTKIQRNNPLTPEDKCWDMIESDLDYAATYLPVTLPAARFGRLTSGAAYALKSRAMLFAKRWQKALDAANAVIDMTVDGKKIYSLVDGKTAANYAKAFKSNVAGANPESILEYNYLLAKPNHNYDGLFSPGGDAATKGGRATPTQEMVESYEKAVDGGHPDWSPWHTSSETTQTPPYADLEPRFHASILYNGSTWKGRAIEPYVGGKDGWIEFDGSEPHAGQSTTGYFLRKLVDETHTDLAGLQSIQPWIAIRLAEVHLNRAEACYNLGGSNIQMANDDVKAIRERVGLPYANKSGTELFDAIRHERKIELYCEGHLYWDMRRWKLAHKAYSGANSRVHGFRITKEGASYKYLYIDCDKQDRLFQEKMYRIPLPAIELDNNVAVHQFPEWL